MNYRIEKEKLSYDTDGNNMAVEMPENSVQVLVENTSENPELIAEHGLSLYIKYKGREYLLDAGSSSAFMKNAERMKVDLVHTQFVVLSHGHYDHAGGFKEYLAERCENNSEYGNAMICMMKSAVDKYYSGSGGRLHEIGIPQEIIDRYGHRFVFIDKLSKLGPDAYLLPHSTKNLEKIGEKAKLYKMVDGNLVPDNFSHELTLVLDTENGLIVFNSCSHGGIVNIIREVKEAFPDKSIHSFFGGLHMKGMSGDEVICTFSEDEIKNIADYINESGMQKLYTGHCTGEPAIKLLKKYLGDKVEVLSTGKKICI